LKTKAASEKKEGREKKGPEQLPTATLAQLFRQQGL
jgi:hypothetical protein